MNKGSFRKPSIRLGPVATYVTVVVLTTSTLRCTADESATPDLWPTVDDPLPARGVVVVSQFGTEPRQVEAHRHTTEYVAGTHYDGVEDNDIRGFLDGTFKWGWNQPGQIHVRIGRRGTAPIYGEYELFRVLQRWGDIQLPPHAVVTSASLSIEVERGADSDRRIMLYEIKKDWDPGSGGTLENNVSPPKHGEVWWNDVAYGVQSWGLPGAGFASDDHDDADTGQMPLADFLLHPKETTITFASDRLTDFASDRVASGRPLLFLLKLSDYQEDTPGSMIQLYSANHGDSRNRTRRPRLTLEWGSAAVVDRVSKTVFVEYGRSYTERYDVNPEARQFHVEFREGNDGTIPTIEIRGGTGADTSAWLVRSAPFEENWRWMDVRLTAASDPLVIGRVFAAHLRDTWIRTGPPADQQVPWTFVAPSGIEHTVMAQHEGGFRWSVSFYPNELGPSQYTWSQRFTETPYKSAVGSFDVVAGDRRNILECLKELAQKLDSSAAPDDTELNRLMTNFTRFERAALLLEDPDSYRSETGGELRRLLNRIRALLGEPRPDTIPFKPSPPARWEREGF